MTTLLQVSDPHFGTEQAGVERALVHLARELNPDVLLMTGDITQRATAAQFGAARSFAERIGAPHLLVVPGNHDIPLFALGARLLSPYARLQAAFGPDLEPSFESETMLLLCVNSTRAWRHKHGELSTAQIESVERRLEKADERQVRIVALHHPIAVTRSEDERHRPRRHQIAVQRWAAAGADFVLGGHIHLPYTLALHEHQPLSRPLWAVQAGTAVSSRVRDNFCNSVNRLCSLGPDAQHPRRGVVERWDCSDSAFRRVVRLELGLGVRP
jgi:3',5'-cyclic AMP phosphodiesterase CpdA